MLISSTCTAQGAATALLVIAVPTDGAMVIGVGVGSSAMAIGASHMPSRASTSSDGNQPWS